jgi:hypothetical protein
VVKVPYNKPPAPPPPAAPPVFLQPAAPPATAMNSTDFAPTTLNDPLEVKVW